jgi:mRNA interferase MazF
VSELALTKADGVTTESVVNFDNIHTIPRSTFRRRVTTLPDARLPRRAEHSRQRRC